MSAIDNIRSFFLELFVRATSSEKDAHEVLTKVAIAMLPVAVVIICIILVIVWATTSEPAVQKDKEA